MRRDRSSHRAPRTDVGTRTSRTTLLPRLTPHPTVMSPGCPRSAKLLHEQHVHPRQALDRVPVGDRLSDKIAPRYRANSAARTAPTTAASHSTDTRWHLVSLARKWNDIPSRLLTSGQRRRWAAGTAWRHRARSCCVRVAAPGCPSSFGRRTPHPVRVGLTRRHNIGLGGLGLFFLVLAVGLYYLTVRHRSPNSDPLRTT